MSKYIVRFEDGTEMVFTTDDGFRNRLDVVSYICKHRLGKWFGKIVEITVTPFIR